jgi:hypothetical protein
MPNPGYPLHWKPNPDERADATDNRGAPPPTDSDKEAGKEGVEVDD